MMTVYLFVSMLSLIVGRVGAAMLKGEYEEAVRLIMQPHEGEREDSAAARNLYLQRSVYGFRVWL